MRLIFIIPASFHERRKKSKVVLSRLLRFLPVKLARRVTSHCAQQRVVDEREKTQVESRGRLFVDVSILIRHDAGTGIQRVVRAIWRELSENCPEFYVCPVYATRRQGYRHAVNGTVRANDPIVSARFGDVFLGLDWTADILVANDSQLYAWKKNGCKLFFVVYDFLPVLNPEWFPETTVRKYQRWIKTVGVYADGLLCISYVVKENAIFWFNQIFKIGLNNIDLKVFPLGADFSNAKHSVGMTDVEQSWIDSLKSKPYVIQVGTIEPRKGHDDVLSIADNLWQKGVAICLVFVGRAGWKTEFLQDKIKSHPRYAKDLFWFENASDEVLDELYTNAAGAIVASKGEGFGLPLIEASMYKKKILARNIPVFREIAGANVRFFSTGSVSSMVSEFESWLYDLSSDVVRQDHIICTWSESAQSIRRFLLSQ